jgi:hypothetical protein
MSYAISCMASSGVRVQITCDFLSHQAAQKLYGVPQIPVHKVVWPTVQILEDAQHQAGVVQKASRPLSHLRDQVHELDEIPFGMVQERRDDRGELTLLRFLPRAGQEQQHAFDDLEHQVGGISHLSVGRLAKALERLRSPTLGAVDDGLDVRDAHVRSPGESRMRDRTTVDQRRVGWLMPHTYPQLPMSC